MATIYFNLSQQDKDRLEFLIEVLNLERTGRHTVKVNQTNLLQTLIEEFFASNDKQLQLFDSLGKFGALAEIERQLRETPQTKTKKMAKKKQNEGVDEKADSKAGVTNEN